MHGEVAVEPDESNVTCCLSGEERPGELRLDALEVPTVEDAALAMPPCRDPRPVTMGVGLMVGELDTGLARAICRGDDGTIAALRLRF